MTTLKYANGITEHRVTFAQQAGSLLYTVFRMTAWTIGLGALGFATLFYIAGIPELIGGAIRLATATAMIYLVVTQIVKRLFLSGPAAPETDSTGPHAR